MIKYKNVTRQQPAVILCDKCQLEISKKEDPIGFEACLSADFTAGYGSPFGDMSHVQFDVCETCLHTMVIAFATIKEGQ